MSLADKISLARILLVPWVVASLVYYHPTRDRLRFVTLGLFLLAVLSDAVDGYVARSQRQHSPLGAVLDPIADKLLILSSLISLSTIHGLPDWMRIPAWFNLTVISRDALLLVGIGLVHWLQGHVEIRPIRLGKWAIASQMIVILLVLLRLPGKTELLVVSAGLTVLSGIEYLRRGIRLLS